MHERELAIREYYSPTTDSFWSWQDDGETIAWSDGRLIVFGEELSHVLKQLAPQGLPRLGSLLLLMAATRKNWAVDGSEVGLLAGILSTIKDAEYGQVDRSEALLLPTPPSVETKGASGADSSHVALLERVMSGLHKVRALDGSLRTSLKAKSALASIVFQGVAPVVEPKDAVPVADAIRPGLQSLLAGENDTVATGFGPFLLLQDLAAVAPGLERITPEAVRVWMETGLQEIPEPAPLDEVVEEEPPETREAARRVIEELLDSPEHAGMAKLAKQLLATITLPRKLTESNEHEMGGYSDITNRGTPDRLLLSELAQDGLTLAVRVAMNEAMYLHRETPPSVPNIRRELLIDVGVQSWGLPRVFATSVALALAASTPAGATFAASRGSGPLLEPVDLCTKEGLLAHLVSLEADPHLAEALPSFASQIEQAEEAVEAMVVMTAEAYAEPAVIDELRRLKADRLYIATVDRQGTFRLSERRDRGEKILRQAQLQLDQLVTNPSSLRVSRSLDSLPAIFRCKPFPLRLPCAVDGNNSWSVRNWGALSVTGDGRLLQWTNRSRGPRQLTDRLPKGKLWWSSPDISLSGRTHFIYGTSQKPIYYELDIPHGDLQGIALQCSDSSGFTMHNGVLFSIRSHYITGLNVATGEPTHHLMLPSDIRWIGGLFFVNTRTNAWLALSFNGTSLSVEPLPAFGVVNDPVVFVWEALGFDEPLAITRRGNLVASEGDRSKLPKISLPFEIDHVKNVSSDGTRLILVGSSRNREKRYLKLNLRPECTQVYGQLLDDRITRVASPASLRRRFRSVGVTQDRLLALRSSKSIVVIDKKNGQPVLHQISASTRLFEEQEFVDISDVDHLRYSLRIARLGVRFSVVLDSRGLLHLMPDSQQEQEVTIVLAEGELTGWRDDAVVFGRDYYLPEGVEGHEPRLASVRQVFKESIELLLRGLDGID
ncbi:hypothetical protein [Aeoliella mucimassa]|uniref:Uncharacterized protein n=1 Tax=Aeoliella mucimassa TaxID=2527972 RepID=A0A518AUG7_9BACT|nr:hypothetical protein [Aeoliella mucimassa]QDU58345.1 hypothetical protein Pan181_45790 [Aeoliella mucimassa]